MEQFLGRELTSQEHVHHINGNKADNRLANLTILQKAAHHRQHCVPSFDIAAAKIAYDSGVGYRKLAEKFGVSRHSIREAFMRRNWHRPGRKRSSVRIGDFQAVS